MGFIDEKKEAEVKNTELQAQISALQREIKTLSATVASVNRVTKINFEKQVTEAAEKSLIPLGEECRKVIEEIEKSVKKAENVQTNNNVLIAVIVIFTTIAFCIPCFLAGWYFHDNTAEKILWNQTYPQQQVTPFTPDKDFQKMKDNQEAYLKNLENQQKK